MDDHYSSRSRYVFANLIPLDCTNLHTLTIQMAKGVMYLKFVNLFEADDCYSRSRKVYRGRTIFKRKLLFVSLFVRIGIFFVTRKYYDAYLKSKTQLNMAMDLYGYFFVTGKR